VSARRREIVPKEPHDLAAEAVRYLEWLADRGYSESTIYNRRLGLLRFVDWCAERGITRPGELTRVVLERYQKSLAGYRKEDGAPLGLQTQENYLVDVRGFCRWMARRRVILYDPSAELELPRLSDRVPRGILTPEEVERVLAAPDTATPLGLRNRAMLEVLYSTGMRRAELARLAISDIDFERGTALIREGKYRKDRVVPIGERALLWVEKYLREVRPEYLVPPDEGYLFLTRLGKGFVPNGVSETVSKAVKASGIGKRASAHSLRHSCATAMLEGGADIRFIQQMLGHASLTTTQIYTRVAITALKEVHERTHPAAGLRRKRKAEDGTFS